MCRNELKQLEEQNAGLHICNRIEGRCITGPRKTLETIKEKLDEMVTMIQQKQFTIDDIRFSSVDVVEEKDLMAISLANGCLLKTEFNSTEKQYSAPSSSVSKDTSALAPSAMSIDIRIGDLARQSVDMVVVCSTSQLLLDDILNKAGPMVKNEVSEALSNEHIACNGYSTRGGQLLCKQLLFLPWTTQRLNERDLRQSIHTFFTAAIEHALKTQQTSIAFPALGCGELKYNPDLIAEAILHETERHANYNLQILIVLLPKKTEAYEVFCLKLAELRQRKSRGTPSIFSYPYISKYILASTSFICPLHSFFFFIQSRKEHS